jgi:type IV pilus assembly protein PilA
MAVVAIVGILAALATYGVRQYLGAAKSGEAKEMVGAIAKASVAAYERAHNTADAVSFGGEAGGGDPGGSEHQLCGSATWVPTIVGAVKDRKYQPRTGNGVDFGTGTDVDGWKCLRFAVDHPMMYQLNYSHSEPTEDWSHSLSGDFFVARAQGDTDGNGINSRFLRGGQIINDVVTMQTEVWVQNDTE